MTRRNEEGSTGKKREEECNEGKRERSGWRKCTWDRGRDMRSKGEKG